jgi:hypothetical protein
MFPRDGYPSSGRGRELARNAQNKTKPPNGIERVEPGTNATAVEAVPPLIVRLCFLAAYALPPSARSTFRAACDDIGQAHLRNGFYNTKGWKRHLIAVRWSGTVCWELLWCVGAVKMLMAIGPMARDLFVGKK